ncbi:MAG: chemotaxis protein CheW [Microcoleus sp. SIO2G3]|nr:chemotaxis protein CheW [Microcoleus sp. SIO2G3]
MENSLDLEPAANDFGALLLSPLPPETRQRLLRFSFGDRSGDALLLLEQITEILNVNTADILPVPEMPSCVLGIGNWRGEMLWLIDLNDLVGYPSFDLGTSSSLTVVVVEVNHQFLGVGVQKVNDIELHDLQQLQPAVPNLFPPNLLPLVLGTLPGCCDVVLNIQAIAQYPLWKTHPERGD